MSKLNSGYYHETMDRLHIILENLDTHILNQPVCENHKKIRKKVEEGMTALVDAYQLVGQKEFRNESNKED